MTEIRVRINVEVDGNATDNGAPFALAWKRTTHVGDNPRYYGDSIQRAIRSACADAISGAEIYVDLWDEK